MDNFNEIANIYDTYKETNNDLYEKVNQCSKEEIKLEKEIENLQQELLRMEAQ